MSAINGLNGAITHFISAPWKECRHQVDQFKNKIWSNSSSFKINSTRKLQAICHLALAALLAIPVINHLFLAILTSVNQWNAARGTNQLKACYAKFIEGIEGATYKVIKGEKLGYLQVKFYFKDEASRTELIKRIDDRVSYYRNFKQTSGGKSESEFKENAWKKGKEGDLFTYTVNGMQAQMMAGLPVDIYGGTDEKFQRWIQQLFDSQSSN